EPLLHPDQPRCQRPQPTVVLGLRGQVREEARQHLADQAEELTVGRNPHHRLATARPAPRRSPPPDGHDEGQEAATRSNTLQQRGFPDRRSSRASISNDSDWKPSFSAKREVLPVTKPTFTSSL